MTPTETLAGQLETTLQDFIAALQDEEKRVVSNSFEQLQASDIASDAINTGDIAPDFNLQNATGNRIILYDTLSQGPVVLSFYRGGWCPFCNLELQALQQFLPEFKAHGATLIGISPETPDNSMTTAAKHALEFEIGSDAGNRVASSYGLLFTVYEEMRPLYLQWGLDVPARNGEDSWELPVPATYVIGTDRIVRAAHADKDYTKRMEPERVIEALRRL